MLRPHSDEEKEFIEYLVKKHAREPFWKRRMFSCLLIIGIVILIFAVVLVAYPTEDNSYVPSSALDIFGWSEVSAINTAEELVKEYLNFPSSARFSDVRAVLESENVIYNKNKITGKVEAKNTYGMDIKKSFYVDLICYTNPQYGVDNWDVY